MQPPFDPSFLSEEERKRLAEVAARMGGAEKQNSILEDQIQQAIALRAPSNKEYYGGWAGGIGGLGEALKQIGGVVRENRLRGDQAPLLKEMEGLTQEYGNAATQAMARVGQQRQTQYENMLAQALKNGPQPAYVPNQYVDGPTGPKQLAMDDDPRIPRYLRRQRPEENTQPGMLPGLFTRY